jgi:predicted nucleic acid-binding protein
LIAEVKNVLHTKIGSPQEAISDFLAVLTQDSILSECTELKNIDINDEDDILILSTALNGSAELFVTGDGELLELDKIQSMQIVSPRKFWEKLKTQPQDEH